MMMIEMIKIMRKMLRLLSLLFILLLLILLLRIMLLITVNNNFITLIILINKTRKGMLISDVIIPIRNFIFFISTISVTIATITISITIINTISYFGKTSIKLLESPLSYLFSYTPLFPVSRLPARPSCLSHLPSSPPTLSPLLLLSLSLSPLLLLSLALSS